MTFAEQLQPLVAQIGTNESARICGVTPRCIQLWKRGDVTPNVSQQAGALQMLAKAQGKRKREPIAPASAIE